jgi:hypothetical protein
MVGIEEDLSDNIQLWDEDGEFEWMVMWVFIEDIEGEGWREWDIEESEIVFYKGV